MGQKFSCKKKFTGFEKFGCDVQIHSEVNIGSIKHNQ